MENERRMGGDAIARGRDVEEMAEQAVKNLKNARSDGKPVRANNILVTLTQNPSAAEVAKVRKELKEALNEWKDANPFDAPKRDLAKIKINVTTQANINRALRAAEREAAKRAIQVKGASFVAEKPTGPYGQFENGVKQQQSWKNGRTIGSPLVALQALQWNEPSPEAGGNIVAPIDPHISDRLSDEGSWPMRALWAQMTGKPEPTDVPKHIVEARKRMDELEEVRKVEAERAAQEFQQRLQRDPQPSHHALDGAG